MLNSAFRLTPLDSFHSVLHWRSASMDTVSWVFANGSRLLGPHSPGSEQRHVRIPLSATAVAALEIHDFPTTADSPAPTMPRPGVRPTLHWLSVEDAVRYRLYHHSSGSDEKVVGDYPSRPALHRYTVQSPISLDGHGGVWHFFRVESVSRYGVESTRDRWSLYVRHVPASIPRVRVVNGSSAGLYSFSLVS